MISAENIVLLLTDFEKGDISKEKEAILFILLDETLKDAKNMRQKLDTKVIIND